MFRPFIDPDAPLLDARFPLSLEDPFTAADARGSGIHSSELSVLCEQGYVRRLLRGVYVAAQVPDSLELRAAALRLVVPRDAVVTDRTAGWLVGAPMVLAPGDHLVVPTVSMFVSREGARLRNKLSSSGERALRPDEVMEVLGLRVTTPLRTACDLGRLLSRDRAFAALDAMLRLGVFTREELLEAVEQFRGMRGVRQLRGFAPLADGRAESPGESILRLRWLDLLVLPRPELQIEIERSGRLSYWLDLGVVELRFAVEYDGEEWHRRTPAQRERDRKRRTWLRDERDWIIEPVTKDNVFGHHRDIESILVLGVRNARRRLSQQPGRGLAAR
ncbi:MAG: type IV toxin-antitoxin system AbiEi family antitoxin domain-containing protein [Marmoricola sp.]